MSLTEIYWMNLNFLQIMRAHIRQDLAGACYQFDLDVERARQLESLNQDELHALVANCGQESLFQIRNDIGIGLLSFPPGLRAPLAAVALPIHRKESDGNRVINRQVS